MSMLTVENLNVYYGMIHALKGLSFHVGKGEFVSLVGASGCGKSTFLRLLNRMNDLIPGTRLTGEILIDGENIYARQIKSCPFRR